MTELEFEGAGNAVPVCIRNELSVEFGGFIDVLKTEFSQLATDRTFKRNVSESMFIWYGVTCLWSRILLVRRIRGTLSTELDQLLEEINPANAALTNLMHSYLAGYGRCRSVDGDVYYPGEVPIPDVEIQDVSHGWYGRITERTQVKYMSYPAPGVLVARMCADLERTRCDGPEMWVLPDDVYPQEVDAGEPTTNLLGYDRASVLERDSVAALLNCGFTIEDDADDDDEKVAVPYAARDPFCFNRPLFNHFNNYLAAAGRGYDITRGIPSEWDGSPGQMPFLVPEGRSGLRYPMSRVTLYSSEEGAESSAVIALAYAYRVLRLMPGWCCFTFPEGVPELWTAHKDDLFMAGAGRKLAERRFSRTDQDRASVVAQLATRFMTKQ